jgi:hypothetical protein
MAGKTLAKRLTFIALSLLGKLCQVDGLFDTHGGRIWFRRSW